MEIVFIQCIFNGYRLGDHVTNNRDRYAVSHFPICRVNGHNISNRNRWSRTIFHGLIAILGRQCVFLDFNACYRDFLAEIRERLRNMKSYLLSDPPARTASWRMVSSEVR